MKIEDVLRPGAVVPVDIDTTAALVEMVRRLSMDKTIYELMRKAEMQPLSNFEAIQIARYLVDDLKHTDSGWIMQQVAGMRVDNGMKVTLAIAIDGNRSK